ncbi:MULTISPECIES: hypothetical protein [Halobacterium]|uniref:DUF7263 family protein n=1 Tax=Halobacterium TaxID=2239 RepID=UPI00073EF0ED|nr:MULTISPECIES: hypothetical protein [Halobacterium]MCG1002145.1 hypothetical protein [Halobacterium noricense]
MTRAQANLPAVAIALLLVVASVAAVVGLAGSAFAGANTQPVDTRLAASTADHLVAADGPLTLRANVLSQAAVENASATLDDGLPEGAGVRVTLDGETLVERGTPAGGATMRRVVLVADASRRELSPVLDDEAAVTLPRRTGDATLTFDTGAANVTTVRANDRVVLHDDAGLDGAYDVTLSRYDTVTLAFAADGELPPGSVTVAYRVETTTKAVLGVTVDA